MVHCRPETDECRSLAIDGRATFTIVLSRPTMNRLRQQMASTSRRRRRVRSGRVVHLDANICVTQNIVKLQPITKAEVHVFRAGREIPVTRSRPRPVTPAPAVTPGYPNFGQTRTLHAVFLRRDRI